MGRRDYYTMSGLKIWMRMCSKLFLLKKQPDKTKTEAHLDLLDKLMASSRSHSILHFCWPRCTTISIGCER
jgi:hypothetical protein